MALTSTSGAAILTPDEVQALVIRPLIEQAVATQVSTVLHTTTHATRIPVATADPTAGWVAEGAEIAATDATLAQVVITPKKLAGLSIISNELAADSSPAALQTVGDGIVRDLRRKLDAAYFGNATTDGPSGLLSIAATSVNTGGAAWVNLDVFEAAKANAENVSAAVTAFACSPGTALLLSMLKEQTGSNKHLLSPDPTSPTKRTISGVPLFVSPAIADGIVWAIPSAHVVVAIRTDAAVETDRSVYFTSDRTAIRATLRVGVGFTHPAAVTKIVLGV
jgi:HK97 family phage major capsid protein